MPRISKFSLAYPDIDVRLKAVDFDEGFLADDIDVAIYYGRGRWSGIQAEKLHTEFLTPLCSPSLFQGSKPLNSLADLKHHVLLHDSSRAIWKMWLKHFNVFGVNVNQGPVFSHSMMVMQAAALGQGIALGNSVLAKPELDAGRLIMPFEEKLESRDAYYLVCHEGQAEMGKISAFRDWVMNLVQEEQAYV